MTRMDPVTGSVIVAAIAAAASVGSSIINARTSADKLRDTETIRLNTETIRKQRLKIIDLGGDPDDL